MTKIEMKNANKSFEENFMRRVKNIQFFASLDRNGLKIDDKILKIYSTANEDISIIYPGIETERGNEWDFRPYLQVKNTSTSIKDLNFNEIWQSFNNLYENILDNKEFVIFARILYKTAFLQCHKRTEIKKNEFLYVFSQEELDDEEKSILNKTIKIKMLDGNELDISLESFIIFNDLLGANEDCKYFYLGTKSKKNTAKRNIKNPNEITQFHTYDVLRKKIYWANHSGRINTFLTHLHYLLYISTNKIKSHNILYEAISGQAGVFPVDSTILDEFLNEFA